MSSNIGVLTLFEGGLVYAASIAWSNAMMSGIDEIYPQKKDLFRAKLIYAILITIIIIIVIFIIKKISSLFNNIIS